MKLYYLIIILFGLLVVGCKEKNYEQRSIKKVEEIKDIFESKELNDCAANAEMAISKYENNKVDQIPIIVSAFLLGVPGRRLDSLNVYYYDEDYDVLGIGIKEKYYDSDGTETILIEEYPVLIHRTPSLIFNGISISFKTRDSNQRKSEQDWDDYIKTKGIDKLNYPEWKANLPEVWVSLPDPNKVEVEMYIYDQKGNKSNSTKVITEY